MYLDPGVWGLPGIARQAVFYVVSVVKPAASGNSNCVDPAWPADSFDASSPFEVGLSTY